ncbi:MAG: hypothetical protein PUG48_05335 [Clostridia bacterium]|nr:hypothetical protein [Clostridia bacterium]
MNIHDEFIKKANREIDKLTVDVEKKKARIAELRSAIKIHETEKTRDSEFSDNLIKLMSDNGVTSDEDRKAVLSKFEEFMLEMEIEKSENPQTEKVTVSSENIGNKNSSTVKSSGNTNASSTANYQNPTYPYKPTDN